MDGCDVLPFGVPKSMFRVQKYNVNRCLNTSVKMAGTVLVEVNIVANQTALGDYLEFEESPDPLNTVKIMQHIRSW